MKGSFKLLIAIIVTALGWLLYMTFHDGWQQGGDWEYLLGMTIVCYEFIDFMFMIGILAGAKDVFPIGPLSGLVAVIPVIKKWADENL